MRLTIFTPTYNRARTLPTLYASLCSQTCRDFVWLVIDDGSDDETPTLLAVWQAEGRIAMRICRQANGGKARAHNRAVEMCDSELFLCIDSDDALASPKEVNDMLDFWDEQAAHGFYGKITPDEVGGIAAYRSKEQSPVPFPEGRYCSPLCALYQHGYQGETTLIYRTEVLRRFPFPEIEGENFITEATAYDLIDQRYQLLLMRRHCLIADYRDDGYTRRLSQLQWRNPKGFRLLYRQRSALGIGSLRVNLRNYIAFSFIAKADDTIRGSSHPLLTLLLLPYGGLHYLKMRRLAT